MIGPTGCGKTEIARRIAKLSQAPFIKVEATKFTEVGFHGKDVDQIIKDLVEISISMTRKRMKEVRRLSLNFFQFQFQFYFNFISILFQFYFDFISILCHLFCCLGSKGAGGFYSRG